MLNNFFFIIFSRELACAKFEPGNMIPRRKILFRGVNLVSFLTQQTHARAAVMLVKIFAKTREYIGSLYTHRVRVGRGDRECAGVLGMRGSLN